MVTAKQNDQILHTAPFTGSSGNTRPNFWMCVTHCLWSKILLRQNSNTLIHKVAVLHYTSHKYEIGLVLNNVLNTKWKETQFNTITRLKGETQPVDEICFTPGTPFSFKLSIAYKFLCIEHTKLFLYIIWSHNIGIWPHFRKAGAAN